MANTERIETLKEKVHISDIIRAIEKVAPLSLQESWDNSGLQVGSPNAWITGVLTTVDVTPEVVDEAVRLGANLIVSHHPLLFHGLKSITGETRNQKALIAAIKNNITVYSCHTPLDKAEDGLSWQLAKYLGFEPFLPLVPAEPGTKTGLGVICKGDQETPVNFFIDLIKKKFPHMRHSSLEIGPWEIGFIAVCTGSGSSLIPDVLRANCQMFITGDLRHHDFVDYSDQLILVDCGHYETEVFAKYCLRDIILRALPRLTVHVSHKDKTSIEY